eukprot:1280989-Pleurochrysis_carterae.AAC.1
MNKHHRKKRYWAISSVAKHAPSNRFPAKPPPDSLAVFATDLVFPRSGMEHEPTQAAQMLISALFTNTIVVDSEKTALALRDSACVGTGAGRIVALDGFDISVKGMVDDTVPSLLETKHEELKCRLATSVEHVCHLMQAFEASLRELCTEIAEISDALSVAADEKRRRAQARALLESRARLELGSSLATLLDESRVPAGSVAPATPNGNGAHGEKRARDNDSPRTGAGSHLMRTRCRRT